MTILEQIKAKYPNKEGIDDARNIAEAMACVSGTGGRGAGAIADHTWPVYSILYKANGGTGITYADNVAAITPVDLSAPTGWTAPEGKRFKGWATTTSATEVLEAPYYATGNIQLFAIWEDIPAEDPEEETTE